VAILSTGEVCSIEDFIPVGLAWEVGVGTPEFKQRQNQHLQFFGSRGTQGLVAYEHHDNVRQEEGGFLETSTYGDQLNLGL
jgi:hypothetical protein